MSIITAANTDLQPATNKNSNPVPPDLNLILFYMIFIILILLIMVTVLSLTFNFKIEREKRTEFLSRAKDDFEITIRQEILSILVRIRIICL